VALRLIDKITPRTPLMQGHEKFYVIEGDTTTENQKDNQSEPESGGNKSCSAFIANVCLFCQHFRKSGS
jgi:hypothetical protein